MGKNTIACEHKKFVSNCSSCYKRRATKTAAPQVKRKTLDRDYEEQRKKLLVHFMRYEPRDCVPEPAVSHPKLLEEIMWAGSSAKWVSLQGDYLQLLEKRRKAQAASTQQGKRR
jgi:hypothetical protein